MEHCIIFAHPSRDSFCGHILEAYVDEVVAAGHKVRIRDLYGMGFYPVLHDDEYSSTSGRIYDDVADELDTLAHCQAVVLIYPILFGLPPAILKGYVDRVFGSGYSIEDIRAQAGHPAVVGKPLLSFSTSASSLSWLDERGQLSALRDIFDIYLRRGLGMSRSEHVMIDNVVPGMEASYVEAQIQHVRQTARRMCAFIAGGNSALPLTENDSATGITSARRPI